MTKELKKCYCYLDLPYNSTIEQVDSQVKVFIKILRAKALKTGKSKSKKINKIVLCANKIKENIEKNGVPQIEETTHFSTPKELSTQLFVLIAITIIAFVSYFSLI